MLAGTCLVAATVLQVYRVTVEPLVHTLFNNGKATCFAYGQTGSGKTYTMSPLPIRAAEDILHYLERPELRDVELYVSCFEIYGNKVFDLLNMRKKLNILEDGKKKVCVVGLKVRCVGVLGKRILPCSPAALPAVSGNLLWILQHEHIGCADHMPHAAGDHFIARAAYKPPAHQA